MKPQTLGAISTRMESVQRMIETETLELTKVQKVWHFLIVGIFSIPPLMHVWYTFQYFVLDSYHGKLSLAEMGKWSYLPLLPAVLIYYIQKRRLKFKIISGSFDAKRFLGAARVTAKQREWDVLYQSEKVFVAKSGFSWRSWGELITIIRDEERILFNSICDPDNFTSVASWGMNKENYTVFRSILLGEEV